MSMKLFSGRRGSAFTLIELLVVIAIIGILVAIFIPSLGKARHEAKRTGCASNLRQIGIAVKTYLSDNKNEFPPVMRIPDWDKFGLIADYYRPHAGNNYDVFRCPAQGKDLRTLHSGLAFPSDPDEWTTYEFNSYFVRDATNRPVTASRRHVTDATICAYAYDWPYQLTGPNVGYLPHKNGMNVLYVDTHVSWLPADRYVVDGVNFYSRGHP